MLRMPWKHYWMQEALLVSTRATCDRKHVGCILVKDNHRVASGYNGSLRGLPHCDDVGHLFREDRTGCLRTVHAEANAVASAAKLGVSTDGCDAYVTCYPCEDCAKLLIQAGIKRVFYYELYRMSHAAKWFEECGIHVEQVGPLVIDSPEHTTQNSES